MPDVRARVDVVDRGGEVELLLGHELKVSLAGWAERSEQRGFNPAKNKVEKSWRFF
jgi:hypothetical protein